MPDSWFEGLFETTSAASPDVMDFVICVGVSLLIGFLLALSYTYKARYTKNFVVTLALLPAIVCVVILMVNGNIGAGVAVAGAFSLVRFRSIPGTSGEIGAVFLAMATGLAAGMGYPVYALLFACLLSAVGLLYRGSRFAVRKSESADRTLRVTIPEDLEYTDVFEDLFDLYTTRHETMQVKTTNLGSLFRLTYNVTMRTGVSEKEFIDKLRCRNGNLEISLSKQEVSTTDL
jgi:hypothetical protein